MQCICACLLSCIANTCCTTCDKVQPNSPFKVKRFRDYWLIISHNHLVLVNYHTSNTYSTLGYSWCIVKKGSGSLASLQGSLAT